MPNMCPHFEGSDFCEKLRSVSESAFHDYIEKYCKGNFRQCARFIVAEQLGPDAVPEAMLPNETDRALRIIARG